MSAVWLNGTLLDAEQARIDPGDRGFTLGDGLFETVRAEAGVPRRLERHLARLRAGASVLEIPLTWSDAALAEAAGAVGRGSKWPRAALRITLTRGPAPRGLPPPGAPTPTLLIAAHAMAAPAEPARLVIARSTCRNERSPLAALKSTNYLDSIIARSEATRRGADDALLLDTRGRLSEATAANLFVVVDDALVTPPVEDGALPGIARAVLLEAGLATARTLWPRQVEHLTAAFLVNSLSLRAAASIEGHALDPGHPMLEAARAILG